MVYNMILSESAAVYNAFQSAVLQKETAVLRSQCSKLQVSYPPPHTALSLLPVIVHYIALIRRYCSLHRVNHNCTRCYIFASISAPISPSQPHLCFSPSIFVSHSLSLCFHFSTISSFCNSYSVTLPDSI